MHCTLRITPIPDGWRLSTDNDETVSRFDDFDAAERRARFLAVRAAVRGVDSEIEVFEPDGQLRGCWRGERFERPEGRV